jgi:alpha-L-fucosidase
MKYILITVVCFLLTLSLSGQYDQSNEKKLEWWQDARFGMFIHWGPVTLKGTEIGWSRGREISIEEYDTLYKKFEAINFNADDWVSVAKEAGMKYIILTTKHHDGFCLWNTRQTDFNVMNSPLNRDVVKELSEACRKQGIAFGTYYSTCDWHHPDFPLTSPGGSVRRETSNLESYTTYLKRQVGELLLNYGPLVTLWFDVPQEFNAESGQKIIDYVRTIQPDIIINDRTGARGDFDTPEQRVGGFQDGRPWETCMTIGDQWAWKPNDRVKSLEQCLHSLIRSAGGNGNLLFNVGPRPDGQIEPLQIERLKEMGIWLKEYGSSIYGTRGGPFKPSDWGVSTRKGNTIYLHILNWQGSSHEITLPDPGLKIIKCNILGGGTLKYRKVNNEIEIEFKKDSIKPIDTIIEIVFEGSVMEITPMDVKPNSLSFMKSVTCSSNQEPQWSNHLWIDKKSLTNGDWVGDSWHPSENDVNPWIEINLGSVQKVKSAVLYESGQNIKAFQLQYKSGNKWISLYKGKSIGSRLEVAFRETELQNFRLLIEKSDGIPVLYELALQ